MDHYRDSVEYKQRAQSSMAAVTPVIEREPSGDVAQWRFYRETVIAYPLVEFNIPLKRMNLSALMAHKIIYILIHY